MAIASTSSSPLLDYAAPGGVYDETFEAPGRPRKHWQPFLEACRLETVDDLEQRSLHAERMLDDNGVTFNVFGELTTRQRPWRLDILPLLASQAEWLALESGLAQRAALLEALIHDLHGPQVCLREGWLPPQVLFAHPGYMRPFYGLHTTWKRSLVLYGAELARSPSGEWRVMADRSDAPAGPGFALEHRIVVSRTVPHLMHGVTVQRLAPFFIRLQNTLRLLAPRPSDNPRIVLLSAGPKYPHYFEDVYLSRYLGYTLVEGGDLAVRDERVYLKTLAGLLPVDVIFSRGAERGIDLLELGGSASHGVPGLLHAIRQGHVALANMPGCGLVESPVFMAFLPQLCRQLLGEELRVASIPTWWCGDDASRRYVFDHLRSLVIKPAMHASGSDEILGDLLNDQQAELLKSRIAARPHEFVAQERIARSAAPVWRDRQVRPGHVAVRTFLVAHGATYSMMPGALVRVAPTAGPMQLSIDAGEGSKDLWVLSDGPVEPVSLLAAEDRPVQLRRTSAFFPSRVADDLFWLGQALDRSDFLLRLMRSVAERLTAESKADLPELPVLIRALADQGQIEAGYAVDCFDDGLPALERSLPHLVFDTSEVRGLAFAISEMVRLASLVRDWLSPDTWIKIRQSGGNFLSAEPTSSNDLAQVLTVVDDAIVDLASVSGLIQDGMIRGPAWRFLDLGRRIERGRDTIGLLRSTIASERLHDKPVLKSLLEVLDCRMTYRSRYLDNLQQNAVLDLFVTDETNPRSLAFQVLAIADHVDALPQETSSPLRTEEKRAAMSAVHALRMLMPEQLADPSPKAIEQTLAGLEQQLRALADTLTRKYLLHSGSPRQITDSGEWPI